eukprot:9174805-Ditylum_brightwellii.AAC.1
MNTHIQAFLTYADAKQHKMKEEGRRLQAPSKKEEGSTVKSQQDKQGNESSIHTYKCEHIWIGYREEEVNIQVFNVLEEGLGTWPRLQHGLIIPGNK